MRIHDISVGGCCLIDPHEAMGAQIGNEILLRMYWADGHDDVRARLAARVDHRRHLQFLDLKQERVEQLKFLIEPGTRGSQVRQHAAEAAASGPVLQAREIWSSYHGDNVIIEDHVHRLAQIGLYGVQYSLYRNAWPVRDGNVPLSRQEVVNLILFLCNINQQSALLKELGAHLQLLSLKGAK